MNELDTDLTQGLEQLASLGRTRGPSAAVMAAARAQFGAGPLTVNSGEAPTVIPLASRRRVPRRRRVVSLTVALAACACLAAAIGLAVNAPTTHSIMSAATPPTEDAVSVPGPAVASDAELIAAQWFHQKYSVTTGGCTNVDQSWSEINYRYYSTFPANEKPCVPQKLVGAFSSGLDYDTYVHGQPTPITIQAEARRSPAEISGDIASLTGRIRGPGISEDDARTLAIFQFFGEPLTSNARAEAVRELKALPGTTTTSGVDARGRRVIWLSRIMRVDAITASVQLGNDIPPTRIWFGFDPKTDMLISETDGTVDAAGNPGTGPNSAYLLAWDTTGLSRELQKAAVGEDGTHDPKAGCVHPIVADDQPDNVAKACPDNVPAGDYPSSAASPTPTS